MPGQHALGQRRSRRYRVTRAGIHRDADDGVPLGGAAVPAPALTALAHPPTCRICWEQGELEGGATTHPVTGQQLLLGTCRCLGSLAAVHLRCLLEWQRRAPDPATCPTCRAPVTIPTAAARAVRLVPLWRERIQHRVGAALREARVRPAVAVFRVWNAGVVATGAVHAAQAAHRAWLHAPAATCRLRQQPAAQRWQLLPTVFCAAACRMAWGPGGFSSGLYQAKWLGWHALSFAAGLLLEVCSQHLSGAAVAAGAAGAAAAAAARSKAAAAAPGAAGAPWAPMTAAAAGGLHSAAGLLPVLLGSSAVLLQAAGLQHLLPFLQLVAGYQQGINATFRWTSQLLQLPLMAWGSGSGGGSGRPLGRLVAGVVRLLPLLAHGLYRALAA